MPTVRVSEEVLAALEDLRWTARSVSLNGVIEWLLEQIEYEMLEN